jgi:hypothetical protein
MPLIYATDCPFYNHIIFSHSNLIPTITFQGTKAEMIDGKPHTEQVQLRRHNDEKQHTTQPVFLASILPFGTSGFLPPSPIPLCLLLNFQLLSFPLSTAILLLLFTPRLRLDLSQTTGRFRVSYPSLVFHDLHTCRWMERRSPGKSNGRITDANCDDIKGFTGEDSPLNRTVMTR